MKFILLLALLVPFSAFSSFEDFPDWYEDPTDWVLYMLYSDHPLSWTTAPCLTTTGVVGTTVMGFMYATESSGNALGIRTFAKVERNKDLMVEITRYKFQKKKNPTLKIPKRLKELGARVRTALIKRDLEAGFSEQYVLANGRLLYSEEVIFTEITYFLREETKALSQNL